MKPDFGVHLHRLAANNGSFTFKNLKFKEIFKLEANQFTLFTNFLYGETEFTISLDFDNYIVQEILETVKNNFIGNYTELLEFLINPKITNEGYNFLNYQLELSIRAKGGPIFVNQNEEYSPFLIIKVLDGGTFPVTYI
jgi:hypothetical protein